MPLARLRLKPLPATNDNDAQSSLPRGALAFHTKRAAYGRAGFIIAVFVLVAGIIAMPLLQGLAVPIITAREEKPTVIRGSPIAPSLLQPPENG
jgi:hypothetical protein